MHIKEPIVVETDISSPIFVGGRDISSNYNDNIYN